MRRNPENRHQTRRSEHHLRKHRQQKQIKESFSLSCIFLKLPPPQISLIPSPSLNTSFFLSQDCALALTACRVCCVYSFFLIINFSLSLSLSSCTVVNRSLGHLDHDCLPGSVFVEILQRSIGCLLLKGTQQEEGRVEREIRCGRGKVTETLR